MYFAAASLSDELGISESEKVIKMQIFYEISSIAEANDRGSTLIYSGGETFVSNMHIEEVELKIDKANKDELLSQLCN